MSSQIVQIGDWWSTFQHNFLILYPKILISWDGGNSNYLKWINMIGAMVQYYFTPLSKRLGIRSPCSFKLGLGIKSLSTRLGIRSPCSFKLGLGLNHYYVDGTNHLVSPYCLVCYRWDIGLVSSWRSLHTNWRIHKKFMGSNIIKKVVVICCESGSQINNESETPISNSWCEVVTPWNQRQFKL